MSPEDVREVVRLEALAWRAIEGCPGRSVLREPSPALDRWMAQRGRLLSGASCPDPVRLWRLPEGGGLLSYLRAEGRWVHTLNDEAGLRRKCEHLGVGEVLLEDQRGGGSPPSHSPSSAPETTDITSGARGEAPGAQ